MKRRYLTPTQKSELWRNQNRCCAQCASILDLAAGEVRFDHMNPLWCTGTNEYPANWQALCGPCHDIKTAKESGARGKTKRLEKKRLGIAKKRRGSKIESRPFDTSLRKRMDGTVEVRT